MTMRAWEPKRLVTMLSAKIISGGTETTLADCVALDMKYAHGCALTISATYHASANAGVTVNVWTSPDGTNYDTDLYTSFEPSFAAGTTKQKTVPIDASVRFVKVTVKNKDSANAVTVTVKGTVHS